MTLPALALLAGQSTRAQTSAGPVRTQVDTALGSFVIAVDPARAPLTIANYLAYVDQRWLDGGKVYRIVTPANQPPETPHKIEVVQWGMDLPEGKSPPLPPIEHETTQQSGLLHRHGSVSMARSTPGTAASEFFICIGDQPELDFGGRRNPDGQGFAAFGQVVEGMAVVQAIYRKAQAEQYLKPPIVVRSVRRLPAS
ncbi:MAG: peptidylprolyl isomerase [Burkholderiales bacterium]|nr:peptidylprolyl isomerase [Burkholderiales bacterium]